MMEKPDHGGALDSAIALYGGARENWLDLSTGINPEPYPIGPIPAYCWNALPDQAAYDALITAARRFWQVPDQAEVLAAPGASILIANMPALCAGNVRIHGPTYNEHARAFMQAGRMVTEGPAEIEVMVHPNNPDGRLWHDAGHEGCFRIIDESFCDVMPQASHIAQTVHEQMVVLKSFGKFWGLAGLRLGFVIGQAETLAPLHRHLGPWAVSGPALHYGAQALNDAVWADHTRRRLARDAARLDDMVLAKGARLVGGTGLFRLYEVASAPKWQEALARHYVLGRIFPYSARWLRLGLPLHDRWGQLQGALDAMPHE